MTEGRGPDPVKWCACGRHMLELFAQYVDIDPITRESTHEYRHGKLCPVCADDLRRADGERESA